jgi:hypothetical protein
MDTKILPTIPTPHLRICNIGNIHAVRDSYQSYVRSGSDATADIQVELLGRIQWLSKTHSRSPGKPIGSMFSACTHFDPTTVMDGIGPLKYALWHSSLGSSITSERSKALPVWLKRDFMSFGPFIHGVHGRTRDGFFQ